MNCELYERAAIESALRRDPIICEYIKKRENISYDDLITLYSRSMELNGSRQMILFVKAFSKQILLLGVKKISLFKNLKPENIRIEPTAEEIAIIIAQENSTSRLGKNIYFVVVKNVLLDLLSDNFTDILRDVTGSQNTNTDLTSSSSSTSVDISSIIDKTFAEKKIIDPNQSDENQIELPLSTHTSQLPVQPPPPPSSSSLTSSTAISSTIPIIIEEQIIEPIVNRKKSSKRKRKNSDRYHDDDFENEYKKFKNEPISLELPIYTRPHILDDYNSGKKIDELVSNVDELYNNFIINQSNGEEDEIEENDDDDEDNISNNTYISNTPTSINDVEMENVIEELEEQEIEKIESEKTLEKISTLFDENIEKENIEKIEIEENINFISKYSRITDEILAELNEMPNFESNNHHQNHMMNKELTKAATSATASANAINTNIQNELKMVLNTTTINNKSSASDIDM